MSDVIFWLKAALKILPYLSLSHCDYERGKYLSERLVAKFGKGFSKRNPEYFKQVDNTAYCLVENNDKVLLVRAAYSISNAYMFKTELTEYSAESLKMFFEEINSGYAPNRDTISYDYRINDNTAYLYYYSMSLTTRTATIQR